MSSNEIDALLIELIINTIKKEREIEILRQNINEMDEFEPFATFTRFDREEKRIIDVNDISKFLDDNNHFPTEKNTILLKLLLEFYDLNKDNGLTFDE